MSDVVVANRQTLYSRDMESKHKSSLACWEEIKKEKALCDTDGFEGGYFVAVDM